MYIDKVPGEIAQFHQECYKAHALSISCIPYASLTEGKACTIISAIVKEMCKCGMKIAGTCCYYRKLFCYLTFFLTILGFVSNGEYNSFQSKGYTRPLSVFQTWTGAISCFC